jgi:hypothetical protein
MSTSFAKLDFEILKKENCIFLQKVETLHRMLNSKLGRQEDREQRPIQLAECLIETIVYQNAWESTLPKSWRRFANCRNV